MQTRAERGGAACPLVKLQGGEVASSAKHVWDKQVVLQR